MQSLYVGVRKEFLKTVQWMSSLVKKQSNKSTHAPYQVFPLLLGLCNPVSVTQQGRPTADLQPEPEAPQQLGPKLRNPADPPGRP